MPDIAIRFTVGFDDYMSAQLLNKADDFGFRCSLLLIRWIFPILGLCCFGFIFYIWDPYGVFIIRNVNFYFTILIFVVCGVLLVNSRFSFRRQCKNAYRGTLKGTSETQMLFREDKFFAERSGFTKTEYGWNAVESWRENAKVLILSLAPAVFLIVPKHALSESQLHELRELLFQKFRPVS
jgi:hypothetical protein